MREKLFEQSGVIHTIPLLITIIAIGIISFLLITSTAPIGGLSGLLNPKPASHAATSTPCQFLTAPGATPAFCDSFDQPMGKGDRAGDLNGLVWGVSRVTENDNVGQQQYDTWNNVLLNKCGSTIQLPPESDTVICNGTLVEAVNDGGEDTLWAAYPKQPFDISGRTGTVVFDVSDDSQGNHAAWPEFNFTDQPVPAPHPHFAAGILTFPRNSFGFSMAAPCTGKGGVGNGSCFYPNLPPSNFTGKCVTVDGMDMVTNYTVTSDVPFTAKGCVLEPTQVGQMNHFEVKMSQNQVQVWATDPGSTQIREIAEADNITMPLTRGLVWMEDVHYNACKFNTQCNHSFAWDNFGFDGPILPRDLTFDILDNNQAKSPTNYDSNTAPFDGNNGDNTVVNIDLSPYNGLPSKNLGWFAPGDGTKLNLTIPNVTSLGNASSALLEFSYFMLDPGVTFTYALNGHAAHTMTEPLPGSVPGYAAQTIAMPVPLSDLANGSNSLVLSASYGLSVANFDLILVGAGGIPCSINPSQPCTGSPLPTSVPTATVAPTTVPTPTPIASCSKANLGDIDCDGTIGIFDYNIMVANFNKTGTNVQGDLDKSGKVDIFDYNILIGNFGR